MLSEGGRKIESKIGKPEIKKRVEIDEETKEATLLFLESHKKGPELSKEDNDSLSKAIRQLEQLKSGKSYSEISEILKWIKRPSPNEEKLQKEIEDKKKNKNDKKKWCPDENQLHIYLVPRLGLFGKFKKLEEKDI